MARIIHEMRLLCLAIILPALIVAAGGLRLIWIGWQTGKSEERDTLQSQAVLYWDALQSRAVEAGLDDHRSPEHRNDPHPHHRPPHRPPNAPRHMWRDIVLEKLPEVCETVRTSHMAMRQPLAFEVCTAEGTPLYATPDYPENPEFTGETPLAPPFGEGFLRVARPDGGVGVRAQAIRMLSIGACLLVLLVCALVTGGILLVRAVRRERRDARRKTDFIDNVSHELKTPLAGIRLNAELLAENRLPDEEKRRSALDAILIESDRLSRMVSELLDFSRLEKGTRRYNLETFDLATFARDPAELQGVATVSQGRARVSTKGPGHMVVADKDAIRQIGINLVTNAVKYAEGKIDIEVESSLIRYMDRGPGIPPGDEERIFERFYRVDNSLAQKTSGSGLGLSIARSLARGMGGDLTYSPRPDGGSIFTLALKEAPS